MFSRAERRHHRDRLMKARRFYNTGPQDKPRYAARYVDTPCPCSCEMCGNPRRSAWVSTKTRLTLQERRFYCEE